MPFACSVTTRLVSAPCSWVTKPLDSRNKRSFRSAIAAISAIPSPSGRSSGAMSPGSTRNRLSAPIVSPRTSIGSACPEQNPPTHRRCRESRPPASTLVAAEDRLPAQVALKSTAPRSEKATGQARQSAGAAFRTAAISWKQVCGSWTRRARLSRNMTAGLLASRLPARTLVPMQSLVSSDLCRTSASS
jgi:hypothetical protein